MKLKNPDNEKYIKASLAGFAAIAAGLILFFLIFRSEALGRGVDKIAGILKPFFYGAVIAYILTPFCNRIKTGLLKVFGKDREKLAGALSIALAMLLAILIVALLFMLVLPQLVDSIEQLSKTLPGKIQEGGNRIDQFVKDHSQLQDLWKQYGAQWETKLENWTQNSLPKLAQKILGSAATYVQQTFTVLKNVFLGILVSIYILISRRRFGAQAKMLLHGIFPNRAARVIEKEIHYADRMFNGFLVGKIVDSAIIGVLCFIGCLVLHLESPALIAVIVGVTNIIPFFGPFIGAIPCALMLVIQNPAHALTFLIFVVLLQQLDGNIIGPRILGDSTGLSSFWVLFAILLFGGLWGVTGMIVGVPLFAVFYDIIRQLVSIGLGRHGRSGLEAAYKEEFHPELKSEKTEAKV
ncbi:MAG: AI-2E family transporter [Firmicutes bacterium]|nr:AI-2E family transporter [Bacillota bacterium]